MALRFALLTVSDRVSRGVLDDAGGDALEELVIGKGWKVVARQVVPDESAQISEQLATWADTNVSDIVFTTGGTGLSPRDVTPEATAAVADRFVPGIPEAIRSQSMATTIFAMVSRGLAATRGKTLIVNLPGNPSGAVQSAQIIVPILEHAVAIMHGGRH